MSLSIRGTHTLLSAGAGSSLDRLDRWLVDAFLLWRSKHRHNYILLGCLKRISNMKNDCHMTPCCDPLPLSPSRPVSWRCTCLAVRLVGAVRTVSDAVTRQRHRDALAAAATCELVVKTRDCDTSSTVLYRDDQPPLTSLSQ